MSKFTPGPWRINIEMDGADRCIGIVAGKQIPRHFEHSVNPEFNQDWIEDEVTIVELGRDRDYYYPEGGILGEANASLIVTAPRLYEGCRKALTCASLNSDVREFIENVLREVDGGIEQ